MVKKFSELFGASTNQTFKVRYTATCHCGAVRYETCDDPLDSKICHCRVCQKLHGAPMQWAAIFHKHDVRFTAGLNHLHFFNSELNTHERILPCKVSCGLCHTLVADEGRHMWLAFPSLFEFGCATKLPETFKPTCHIFYAKRLIDMNDDLPKWSGHKNKSILLQ